MIMKATDERDYFIYIISCPVEYRVRYAGITYDLASTKDRHFRNKQGTKEKKVWIGNLKKYGLLENKDDFHIGLPYQNLSKEDACKAEFLIGLFYFLCKDGLTNDMSCLGNIPPNHKGKKQSIETIEKRKRSMKKKKRQTAQKISESWTEKRKQKQSEIWKSDENPMKSPKIVEKAKKVRWTEEKRKEHGDKKKNYWEKNKDILEEMSGKWTGDGNPMKNPEVSKKISEAVKKNPPMKNPEVYEKVWSEENRRKASIRMKENNPFHDEQVRKKHKQAVEKFKKPISQYDLDGIWIRDWDSATDVSNETGICRPTIVKCCLKHKENGKKYTGGGFIWRYKDG